ncbi:MAG TPA: oligoendopeptidase F [bacterium]|jgi:oligoendopeptidase F
MRQFQHPKAPHLLFGFVLSALLVVMLSLPVTGQELKERSEVADKYKWDLSALYKSDADWDKDLKTVEAMVPTLKGFEGKVSKSPDDLLGFYKAAEAAGKLIDNLQVYSGLAYDQDTRVQKYTGMKDRLGSVQSKIGEAMSWFTPELVSIPTATLESWYKSKPDLALYRHKVDDAFRTRAHTLSPVEERLLALSGETAGGYVNANTSLRVTDIKFPTMKDEQGNDVQLSEGRMGMLLRSSDARVRRDCAIGMLNTYKQYENTEAALMTGNIAGDLFYARARHYNSCVQAALDNDNIDTTVYLNLIETVKKNTATIQRYADLRRRALKLDSIHFYDMFAPLIPETKQHVEYDDAVKTIELAMAPLGKDYVEPMKVGFNSRWIDVYETKAKRDGAYSWGSYMAHPYMLLNYNNQLDDMFTTAHEMGHSMHTWHSNKYQPYAYSQYTLFNAEVASTFNEALLMDYLLKKEKDPAKRLYLINQYIDNIRGTVITQVMFADFELKMHRAAEAGEPLTAESLSQMYIETLKSYYGNSVVLDPEYGYTWARIPHFYRNFYVYKYATSYCASQALSQKVLKGEKGAREAYIGYLSGGSSKYPLDLLKDAGVDMSTSAPVDATMKKLSELVDEMERLLKQTKRI